MLAVTWTLVRGTWVTDVGTERKCCDVTPTGDATSSTTLSAGRRRGAGRAGVRKEGGAGNRKTWLVYNERDSKVLFLRAHPSNDCICSKLYCMGCGNGSSGSYAAPFVIIKTSKWGAAAHYTNCVSLNVFFVPFVVAAADVKCVPAGAMPAGGGGERRGTTCGLQVPDLLNSACGSSTWHIQSTYLVLDLSTQNFFYITSIFLLKTTITY